MNEHGLTNKTRTLLNKLVQSGAPMYFLKVHGSIYQKANQPDFFICICGLLYQLETKHPNEEPVPDPGQEVEFKKWIHAGAKLVTLNQMNAIKEMLHYAFVRAGVELNEDQLKLLLPK